jgi:hypothetical protein
MRCGFLDNVTAHPGIADYGWPDCEENHHPYAPGANRAHTVAPLIELPAYATIHRRHFLSEH